MKYIIINYCIITVSSRINHGTPLLRTPRYKRHPLFLTVMKSPMITPDNREILDITEAINYVPDPKGLRNVIVQFYLHSHWSKFSALLRINREIVSSWLSKRAMGPAKMSPQSLSLLRHSLPRSSSKQEVQLKKDEREMK